MSLECVVTHAFRGIRSSISTVKFEVIIIKSLELDDFLLYYGD